MTVYAVLAPPVAPGAARPDPDGFVFVKEGFSWPAFFVTAIWLLVKRMWIVFALYLAVAVAVYGLAAELNEISAWLIVMSFGIIVGLEANNLRRWTLERRGYRFVGAASGDRLAEAEFRFFASWPGLRAGTKTPPSPRALIAPPRPTNEIVGFFPKPGGVS